LELNSTQRLFDSRLGIHSLLFRPPYATDIEPETVDQVDPLVYTSAMGYYTIGMQIDPSDWSRPGVDAIVKAVVTAAENHQGNIVLLHDSGGDRTETIAALPQIIEQLQAKGFEFVRVSNLIGKTPEEVNPVIHEEKDPFIFSNNTLFVAGRWLNWLVYYLFLMGIFLGILRLLFMVTLAVIQKHQAKKRLVHQDFQPLVSVLIAAYNEEKVIGRTVRNLLNSTYKNFEVIIIDDGSQDGTFAHVQEHFGIERKIRMYRKENGGKSAALNFGLQKARGEVVIVLDADTLFDRQTIEKLIQPLADQQVGAVAGNAKVGNRVNLLTNWQALEYITSQNLDRRAFDVLNCISVVPGAIGAWRSALLDEVGGFAHDTLAEDADVTLKIIRLGFHIRYVDDAFAYTEAPESVGAFLKQRFRWMYGTFQCAWKHRDTLFRPKYGSLGFWALPNIFIFQIFFPLISPVMDLLMVIGLGNLIWQAMNHPLEASPDFFFHALFYYALFLLVDYTAAVVAFSLEKKEDWKLLVWLFFQRFFYRQLMYYVAIKSVFAAIQGKLVGWNKLERTGSVSEHH
jgi:cellulose synthase/poly-beta-1,6-N-acetylglucosamine synthase-like glycosyltransferase